MASAFLPICCQGPDDEAAAAAARAALESGAFGDDWQFSADGTETPCGELDAALRAVARSRALAEPHAPGLGRFLAAADQRGASHCIVFASPGALAAGGALTTGGGNFGGRFSLVLAVDGMAEGQRLPAWRRLLLRPAERGCKQGPKRQKHSQYKGRQYSAGGGSRQELLVLCRQLAPQLASIILVDRATGICYDGKLRRI